MQKYSKISKFLDGSGIYAKKNGLREGEEIPLRGMELRV